MGDNTTAALIGAGSSALGGVVGLLSNSAHRQYKYQKNLMQQQNAMNQENATIAYNRSRQLTQDAPLLEKQGKQMAGINTAFGQNGNVANAASAPQADGVSIPSPPDVMASQNAFTNGINNAVNQLIGISTAKANVAKLNAETEGVEIDNLTRNIKNLKEIGLKDSQIRKNFADLAYQKVVNKYADSRLSAEADSANSKAIIDAADASVRGAMNKIDFDNKVQDLSNKVQTGILTQRQAVTEMHRWSLMESERLKNLASANESNAKAEGQNIENYVNNNTKSDKIATIRSQRIKAWYDAQPSAIQHVIMTSQPVRNAIHKLQVGKDLSAAEYSALGMAIGYENLGKLAGTIVDAISVKTAPKPKVSIVKHVSSRKK
jgi:hypothetical protein